MKYKVDDKVKIIGNLVMGQQYDMATLDDFGFPEGTDVAVKEMLEYAGQEATIVDAFESGYNIDLDRGFWNWTDAMFE